MGTWKQLIKIRDTAVIKLRDDPNNESLKQIVGRSIFLMKKLNAAGGKRVEPEAESFISDLAKNYFL